MLRQLLQQLRAAHRFAPRNFIELRFGADRIGCLRPELSATLRAFPAAFAHEEGAVRVVSAAQFESAVRALASQGHIAGWRNERYDVFAHAPGELRGKTPGVPVFTAERAAFRRFGLQARSAHLNGWVATAQGLKLWIARRSPAKQIDPGMLDNVVAGGIPAASSPLETLQRECREEADIPESMARHVVPAGSFEVLHTVPEGVSHETIHVFDLELPADFAPVNRDAEVAEFALLAVDEVVSRLAAKRFTVDAGAVTLDFLWRRGLLRDPRLGAALERLRGGVKAPDRR